jgi:hypothetical protein
VRGFRRKGEAFVVVEVFERRAAMTHAQQYIDQARQMQALSLTVHLPLVCFGIAFPLLCFR